MGADFYTGVPGSGKSYHCAQIIYNELRKGKNIISNIEIDISKIPQKGKTPLGNIFMFQIENGCLILYDNIKKIIEVILLLFFNPVRTNFRLYRA